MTVPPALAVAPPNVAETVTVPPRGAVVADKEMVRKGKFLPYTVCTARNPGSKVSSRIRVVRNLIFHWEFNCCR
jgi:hypothetical protein